MALVPFSYNWRSLFVRKSSTLLTIFSIAATVAVLAGMLALQQGFQNIFTERGRLDLAVMMRPGAGSEGQSAFPRQLTDILIKSTPEFKAGKNGQPLAAAELYLAARRFKVDGGETNVPLRGVQPATFEIHGDDVKIIRGRMPTQGSDEVIVGQRLVGRIRDCELDAKLVLNITPFKVVGIFRAKGGYESEIWGDADRMMKALDRPVFNRVIGVLKNPSEIGALAKRLEDDKRVPAKVVNEQEYLTSQTKVLSITFIALGGFLAVLMGLAAILTGTNSLLSSLTARTHEIGILLAMGYRPFAIFVAFLMEAVFLGLLGGIVGCLLVLPLNGIQTGTTNFQTFSEVAFAFRTTPTVLVSSVVFAVVLGLIGGAIPAFRASRLEPTAALRRG